MVLGLAKRIRTNGGLWVSWPEKSSPLATELRNSHVRDAGLRAGLVDNKVGPSSRVGLACVSCTGSRIAKR